MDDTLVVGVDFGTIFSGVAFAYSGNAQGADEINVIKTWPGGNNITFDKVPSELAYGPHDLAGCGQTRSSLLRHPTSLPSSLARSDCLDAFSARGKLQMQELTDQRLRSPPGFPYLLRRGPPPLLLDPVQPLPDYVSLADTQRQLLASPKNAGTGVADLRRAVYGHAKETMARRLGEQFVTTPKIKIVCTVPAVCSDTAKYATLKAAIAAGRDSIALVSEPEAGALYTLQSIGPSFLHIGENFVVIDAGGGTVDLITYSIKLRASMTQRDHLWGQCRSEYGSCYSRLVFDVGMQIDSGGLRFDLRVDGVVYGDVTMTFE
ncbi:hypothetical protein LTR62_005743 [Meristemomyces frigidus]|uniref:Uncharacterized protein n=1 Tax=Meristemomyces frigidus TaxID=1508187 RepID=A0AAN7TP62_9PEZI|nr:hypothetical protein LTR62_005743 [Meristemomyces frigidus]